MRPRVGVVRFTIAHHSWRPAKELGVSPNPLLMLPLKFQEL